jgi:hypothetical protein
MLLKFHAKPGQSCAWPNSYFPGQARRFVGRKFIPGDSPQAPSRYEATAEPAELSSDAPQAAHLIRKCQKGEIWPADKATAEACGVEFVELARGEDGEWFAASKKPAAPAAPKPAKKD